MHPGEEDHRPCYDPVVRHLYGIQSIVLSFKKGEIDGLSSTGREPIPRKGLRPQVLDGMRCDRLDKTYRIIIAQEIAEAGPFQ